MVECFINFRPLGLLLEFQFVFFFDFFDMRPF
jgi:hypothetical protein